jgi:hypothetical protein
MLRQRNEMTTIARLGYQGNANNKAKFGQPVLNAAADWYLLMLVFLIIFTWLLMEMVSLARIMQAQGGMRLMLMICKSLGISPGDTALERVVPSVV